MDRDQLEAWLEQGLSLNQIGALTSRDPSTVGYWVKKHGLTANGRWKYAPRGGLTHEQLEPLVEQGLSLRQIAQRLDRSTSTVRHWMAKLGLELSRRRTANAEAAHEALVAGQNRFGGLCAVHGETEFLVFRSGRHRCARCNVDAVMRRRRKVKRTLVEEAGGGCARCGFAEDVSALQFHHLDPAQKEFGLAQRGVTLAIDRSRAEVRKCALLCANCHAMVESGAVTLS